MSSLKSTFVAAFAASVTLIPVHAGAQEPEFRYFTPYSSILERFESGADMGGFKLCTTDGWTPEVSGNEERLEGVRAVITSSPKDAVLNTEAGACDFTGLRWDNEADRKTFESLLRGHKPIPSLNGE